MNTKTSTIERGGKLRGRRSGTLKHGFVGSTTLLPDENERHYLELRDGLLASLKPEGRVEEELAGRVVGLMWRMRRIDRLEIEILKGLSVESEVRQKEKRVKWLSKMVSSDIVNLHQFTNGPQIYAERERLMEEVREMLKRERPASFGQGLLMEETDRSFGLLRRYESRIERSLYLALGQLGQLQAGRKAEEKLANRVATLPRVTLVTNGQLRECEWQPD